MIYCRFVQNELIAISHISRNNKIATRKIIKCFRCFDSCEAKCNGVELCVERERVEVDREEECADWREEEGAHGR